MTKRVIIVADSKKATGAQRDTITRHLKAKGWGFWHWYADLWLIPRVPSEKTLRQIWVEIDNLFSPSEKPSILVLDGEGEDRCSGRAKTAAWPWIKRSWKKGPR